MASASTTIDNDGDGNVWYHLNTAPSTGATWYCHSGYGHVTSASYNGSALSPDNWLVSPLVNLCGEVSFWAAGQDPSWASEKFAVYVTTGDPTDVSSYVKISDDETAVGEVTYYHYDLSAYDGQRGYVAIRHYNVSDMFRLNVDDITIGDPDAEIVEIPDWIYVYDLDETEYTIEGLTPETEYEVQVQSFNAGGASDWTTSVNFTTLAEIPDVYILGQVNSQDWAANAGTQMAYDAENQVYTATVTLDGRGESGENYFSFTTVLAENNDDGGWAYIKPYRFGAVTENYSDFWYDDMYDGQALSLCYPDEDHDPAAFRVMAGDYEMTLSLKNMTLILHKLGEEPVYLRGDVNKDGDVTISDVTALIDALLSGNLDEAEDFSPDNADANLDDSISIGDVTTIIDYLLSHNWPE